MPAARTRGATSRSTRRTASSFCRPDRPRTTLYGGDRQGNNLFGNCLLALDARTGKRLWHFQIVHHDLWDYDNAAAPKLLTVNHNGKPIDIVAQAGKTGFLYVFERQDRHAALAHRRAACSQERSPGRVLVAHAADSHQASAVRAAVDDAGRSESVRQRRRAGDAEATRPRRGEPGCVHAVEPFASAHPVSRRMGRRQLGQHRRRSRDRDGLRAQPGDDQLPQDVARDARQRRWRRTRTGRAAWTARAGGPERLHAALLRMSRAGADADAIAAGDRLAGIPLDRAPGHERDAGVRCVDDLQ